MADSDSYGITNRRPTNEWENDSSDINTKRVSLWGWDGSSKVKIKVDGGGSLVTNELGSVATQAATQCSADGTNTPASAAITSTNTHMTIMNEGDKEVYMGGSNVTTAIGVKLFPSQSWVFANCSSTFKVYLIPDVGDTTEVRTMER